MYMFTENSVHLKLSEWNTHHLFYCANRSCYCTHQLAWLFSWLWARTWGWLVTKKNEAISLIYLGHVKTATMAGPLSCLCSTNRFYWGKWGQDKKDVRPCHRAVVWITDSEILWWVIQCPVLTYTIEWHSIPTTQASRRFPNKPLFGPQLAGELPSQRHLA